MDDAVSTVPNKATCIRQVSNWSSVKPHHRFENALFDPMALRKELAVTSPKMKALFETMDALDRRDQKMEKRLFKHVIFSDVTHGYGAKIITSSCIAMGLRLVYDANLKWIPEEEQVPYYNFALLSSTQIFNTSFPTSLRRKIIDTFNRRPENSHGEQLRVIVLDSGYKEGIDLFDVKYIHLFEPTVSAADETQVIGRGTRYCGQKGLVFHPTLGWPIHVYRYELEIPLALRPMLEGEARMFPLYLKYAQLDFRKIMFANELERVSIECAVDYTLNKPVHRFGISESEKDIEYIKDLFKSFAYSFDPRRYARLERPVTVRVPKVAVVPKVGAEAVPESVGGKRDTKHKVTKPANAAKPTKGAQSAKGETLVPPAPKEYYTYADMTAFVQKNYKGFRWNQIQMENKCLLDDEALLRTPSATGTKQPTLVEFTPTQNFMRSYFQPASVYKGVLAWHSVGTGKTCMAIATATTRFESQGYTILWVTRHTLKPDIWKNMYDQVCSISLRDKLRKGSVKDRWTLPVERPMDRMGKAWVPPISYKQFTNFLNRKNQLYAQMVARNGAADPLRKTLVIIDEAHKLYTTDIPAQERPDVEILKQMIQASYEQSGADSVRLLLMSATPYTTEPMNLVKLLNLLMPVSKNLPETFEDFAATYLNPMGMFSPDGLVKYRDAIAGYISYLNREKDARQFAYPIRHDVNVPISENQSKIIGARLVSLEKDIQSLEKRSTELQSASKTLRRQIKQEKETYIAQVCARQPRDKVKMCQAYAEQKSEEQQRTMMTDIQRSLLRTGELLKSKKSTLDYLNQQFKFLKETDNSQERALLERCGFAPPTPPTRRRSSLPKPTPVPELTSVPKATPVPTAPPVVPEVSPVEPTEETASTPGWSTRTEQSNAERPLSAEFGAEPSPVSMGSTTSTERSAASAEGLNAEGLNAEGLNAEGLNAEGLNAEGPNAEGRVGGKKVKQKRR